MTEKKNYFIAVEGRKITTYPLDYKSEWEIGRVTDEDDPDIKFYKASVSRHHGILKNVMGKWHYYDSFGINGTCYNGSFLAKPVNGRGKPKHLKHGDVFVFGNKNNPKINFEIAWGMYLVGEYGSEWDVIDTRGCANLEFSDGDKKVKLKNPLPGYIYETSKGSAIYMGDFTYLYGAVELKLS